MKIDRDALLHHLGGFTLEYALRLVSESLGKIKMIVEGFDDQSKFSLAELYKLRIRYVQGYLLGKAEKSVYRLSDEDEQRIQSINLRDRRVRPEGPGKCHEQSRPGNRREHRTRFTGWILTFLDLLSGFSGSVRRG